MNVFYLARKALGNEQAQIVLSKLLKNWHICPVNDKVLKQALALGWSDFEDAVQHTCAAQQGIDTLVTRNLHDYRQASLTVFSPTDFLKRLSPPEA